MPGPIAATCTPASRRANRARRVQSASEERVDTVGGGEHHPGVVAEIGQLELERLHRDRRKLDHLRAEIRELRATRRLLTRA